MVKEVSSDGFLSEVLEADIPVLVDFWAPACAPCRRIGPGPNPAEGEGRP